ncbi:MAG: Divalent-cation tolerance protein CutA [Proteobacteria bacterium]|nr:MAG: Divalent-cation tolerance protein CutA [Pseudomonadota bacterium]
MSSYSIIYTTLDEKDEAKKLAKHLVENKFAACVNMHKKVTSFYMWEGELKEEKEIVLLVKTRTDMVEKVMFEIKHHHPYDIPALYSFSIDKGDTQYLSWVDQQLI